MKERKDMIAQGRRRWWKKLLACHLCGILVFPAFCSYPVSALDLEGGRKQAASSSALEAFGEAEENGESQTATASDASRQETKASLSNAVRAINSLGNIWDSWSGKTSFEFLNGTQGDGSESRPFLIKNREQLMGLSELTAMGMTVPDAEGADYAGDYTGCFFALGGNIDMQGVDWIPIGFYRDSSEMPGEVEYAFQGDFDGNGYTIRNLRLNKLGNYDHIGLFGAIANSKIHDFCMIPDTEIKGNDRIGTVAGYAVDSEIRNVTVKNAALNTSGIVGGIAGEISGTIIENAVCDNVLIDARAGKEVIYIGGIAGIASNSLIADCTVATGTGNTARIQGTGYTGGIAGLQNSADIYNVHVNGTIGGYHSTAIGGVTGKYVSGKLKVARFEGTIGNSQLGAMAREGAFIGTRQGAATNFNYIDDVAYLFTDRESKISANVCGSEIADDNDYTYAAHIGYWHSGDLHYTLVQGGTSKNIADRYFYEELEDGILSVMDETDDNRYTIDHFAPDSTGRPVRGYLINVNQIDTTANGRNFYDVAVLEARGVSQYSGVLDKNHRGAVAAGSVVYVNTSPNNTETEKFQMNGTPYYIDGDGIKKNIAYSADSHCYTFRMPEEDIVVDAVYKKVAAAVDVQPDVCHFTVTQTRTGNRKNPVKTTEIRNKAGKLIARYINGLLEQGTEVQPVTIQAVIDANNDVSDERVRWSIDDADLIRLEKNDDEDSDGYTAKSASITVNLNAGFFNDIIREQERKQQEENYRYRIPNTIYGAGHQNGAVAIMTAETRPSASFEGKPCTANCRINVTFQILDNTLVAAEGAVLDKQTLEYTVTRRLTGNRIEPEESILVTAPQSLTAEFEPDYFSRDEVSWKASDPAVIRINEEEASYKEVSVSAYKDAKWIRDIIAADNGKKENDNYTLLTGNGERSACVTVEGTDKLGNRATAECMVTVRFVTEDRTRIVPDAVKLNQTAMEYRLTYDKAGDIHSETVGKGGFERRTLTATVSPDIEDSESHRPFDRSIVWSSSDSEALSVDADGTLTVNDGAPWILEALSRQPYQAVKTVDITAAANDGLRTDRCRVTLNFQANCIEADQEKEVFPITLTLIGRRSAPVLTFSGQEARELSAVIYSSHPDVSQIVWSSEDPDLVTVTRNGTVAPVLLDENNEQKALWIRDLLRSGAYSGTKTVLVNASTADGKMKDSVLIELNLKVIDRTYPSGGSGGGGTGGMGTTTGVTPSGKTTGQAGANGAVTGTWTQTANGKWIFASDRTYANEWAYINNPYAAGNQPEAAWFRFDEEGFMVTGWFTDQNGNLYYLNPAIDGTQGQMLTGWQQIDGSWYYFNSSSKEVMGKLLTNTVIDGSFLVNEKGQWIP
ncbi:hypothetical protein NO348_12700 [Hungatella hathewayi]|uniref:N-acetylmuramoyl-L-alanine amidase family protein n=1 Tax=Hungatella hathewayi TaxID=154046 RepID=UPI00210B6AB5|nr:hypothetical protein [Hungatella hathewayi]MCQ5385680.1 hypothetical protein [Hungatella hathewayi]